MIKLYLCLIKYHSVRRIGVEQWRCRSIDSEIRMLQVLSFLAAPSTAALSHGKLASVAATRYSCLAEDRGKRHALCTEVTGYVNARVGQPLGKYAEVPF
jgi:hypothetical protein